MARKKSIKLKSLKPFAQFYDSPEGVYIWTDPPEMKVDLAFTAIIVLTNILVQHGLDTDTLLSDLRKNVATVQLEKVVRQ